jgi:hypothetical protein
MAFMVDERVGDFVRVVQNTCRAKVYSGYKVLT